LLSIGWASVQERAMANGGVGRYQLVSLLSTTGVRAPVVNLYFLTAAIK
jgi:hypothetical protein